METLLIVVGVTLTISAFCSLLEATLYSTRITTLEAAKGEGRHRSAAIRFLELKRDVASPTSAILILNTIANTAGATVAGWLAARAFGTGFVPLFSALLTIAILFLSEILPKTYGATNWKSLWPWLALPLGALVRVLAPAVWVTNKFSELFTSSSRLPVVTESEIRASIRMSARSGELSADELQILDAVFHFDDTTVRQVLVPRDAVTFCDLSAPVSDFARLLEQTRYTRYPACRGDLDDVVGMLHARDLAGMALEESTDLSKLVRDVLRVPETLRISLLLRDMQAERKHLAVVIDEHGTVSGIITLTEVLEQIVGSLRDEFETPGKLPIVQEKSGSFLVRGSISLAQLNRELGLDLYDPSTVTLSGLLVTRAGRLLKVGDEVEVEGATASVVAALPNRATQIRLRLTLPAPSRPEDREDSEDADEI